MVKRLRNLAFLLSLLGMIALASGQIYAAPGGPKGDKGQKGGKGHGNGHGQGKNKGGRGDDRHNDRSFDRGDRSDRGHKKDRGWGDQQRRVNWNFPAQQQQHPGNWGRRSEWRGRDAWRASRGSDDRRGREHRRDRRDDRRPVYGAPQGFWNQIWNANRRDDRRFEKEQRKFFKEQRKYIKEQRKAQQRYDRDRYRNYDRNVYLQRRAYQNYDDPYGYNVYESAGGSDWQNLIMRNVISSVLGGGGFDAGSLLGSTRYVRSVPSYSYNTPSYVYNDVYTARRPYYGPAEVGYYDEPYNDSPMSGLLGSLPIAEIVQQLTGDNEFVSSLVGGFLSQGYEQGILAGQTARQYGYDDEYYNDPYAYSDGSYDLHSAALAENRQYLSQGYELGYRDALEGNAGYDEYGGGNVDLVSALLNNVLSGI